MMDANGRTPTLGLLAAATRYGPFMFLAVALIVAGCSTHARQLVVARQQYYEGELDAAAETLRLQAEQAPRDADVTALDGALIDLVSGRPAEAESALRVVRDRFDELEEADIPEQGLSLVTDDQRLAYAGTSYEKTLIRVFLAIANLVHDGGDVEAYSLQINAKQQQLARQLTELNDDEAESAYRPLAVGPYLRGVIREASFANYDDAARAYRQVTRWRPAFRAGVVDLQRAEQSVHSRPGNGVVYVMALVGRGPFRQQAVEVPTSQALLLTDRIVSALGPYEVPPTVAPIKIPRVTVPQRTIDYLTVAVDGRPAGATDVICDVADLALRQQAVELPHVMARAIARRIVKKAAVYAAKDQLSAESGLTDIALTAAGVVWEAAEAADTRCWGLLPREIQVLRIELPAGRHELAIRPLASGTSVGQEATVAVEVFDGRNTYVLANFPDDRLIGTILHHSP